MHKSSLLQKKTKASFSFPPLPKPLSHDAYRTSKGIESFLLFFLKTRTDCFPKFQLRKELTLTDSYFVGNAHTKQINKFVFFPAFQRDFLFKASLKTFLFEPQSLMDLSRLYFAVQLEACYMRIYAYVLFV